MPGMARIIRARRLTCTALVVALIATVIGSAMPWAPAGPAPAAPLRQQGDCEAAGLITLPSSGLCTHGPDPLPPGADPSRSVSPIDEVSAASVAAVCDGDGVSGP